MEPVVHLKWGHWEGQLFFGSVTTILGGGVTDDAAEEAAGASAAPLGGVLAISLVIHSAKNS